MLVGLLLALCSPCLLLWLCHHLRHVIRPLFLPRHGFGLCLSVFNVIRSIRISHRPILLLLFYISSYLLGWIKRFAVLLVRIFGMCIW